MKTSAIVTACAASLAALTIGYAVYFDYKRRNDVNFRRKLYEEQKALKRKSKKEKKAEELPKPIPKDDTDLPLEEILKKTGEERQKIFYQMLIKGEELLKLGGVYYLILGPLYLNASIGYFYKAMKMVPSPTELLVAFQKTLPANVFAALIEFIKKEDRERVAKYFSKLSGGNQNVNFKANEVTDPEGKKITSWILVATKDVEKEEELFLDSPVISSVVSSVAMTDYCETCQKLLHNKDIVCDKCNLGNYCSENCKQSAQKFHEYLCPKDKENTEASEDHPYYRLIKLCKENSTSFGLFMAKYLALLLSEELQGNTHQESNPFLHFEYLKSVKVPSNDIDARELLLLRLLFGNYNAGMLEFLTLDRYLSLKNTIRFNAIGFELEEKEDKEDLKDADECLGANDDQTQEKKDEQTSETESEKHLETTSDTETVFIDKSETPVKSKAEHFRSTLSEELIKGFGLYHLASHIQHCCDPNSKITKSIKNNNEITVIATKRIKKGDEITISYLPLEGKSALERQNLLAKHFQLICECNACEAEITVSRK